MVIRITSYHPGLSFFLDQSAPDGVTVERTPAVERRGAGEDTLFEILITVSQLTSATSASIIGAWIYDKIKEYSAESVEVDGKKVGVTVGEIESAIKVSVTHQF